MVETVNFLLILGFEFVPYQLISSRTLAEAAAWLFPKTDD
jgi:hypothetical protein